MVFKLPVFIKTMIENLELILTLQYSSCVVILAFYVDHGHNIVKSVSKGGYYVREVSSKIMFNSGYLLEYTPTHVNGNTVDCGRLLSLSLSFWNV